MKYYCDTIPLPLAEKLKEKGMLSLLLVGTVMPTYAECFDWLISRGYRIIIHTRPANEPVLWFAYIATMEPDYCIIGDTRDCFSWHEAAEKAIEKALELI